MRRFYIPDLPDRPTTLTLPESEAIHASRVLRVRPGDVVTALNGMGIRALARVESVEPKRVDLEILNIDREPLPPVQITLFQALTKPRSMDWLIEKATELGVSRVQPTVTERVVSRFNEGDAGKKREKWQRTAIEAIKQCGGAWLPDIEAPESLSKLLAGAARFDHHIVASLVPGTQPLRAQLTALDPQAMLLSPVQIGIWIGPEGDFTPAETKELIHAGAIPMTLGPNVLRSETASICAISLVRYELEWLYGTSGNSL
jgi:16S rRNA (uracil1498-N3)-methyltransferase